MNAICVVDWLINNLIRLPAWFVRQAEGKFLSPLRSLRVRIHLLSRGVDIGGHRIKVNGPVDMHIAKGAKLSLGGNLFLSHSSIRVEEHGELNLGQDVVIRGAEVRVSKDGALTVGDHVLIERVDPFPVLLAILDGKAIIGAETRMRASCRVQYGGVLRIGQKNFLNQGTDIRCDFSVEIGNSNLISYEVSILDTNTHSTDWRVRQDSIRRHSVAREPRPKVRATVIADHCWIGRRATVLKGSTICAGVVIGASAVVSGEIPAGDVAFGNPARHKPIVNEASTPIAASVRS